MNPNLLTRDQLTLLARNLTQREWDKLFPPRTTEHEPTDASGFSGEVEVFIIG